MSRTLIRAAAITTAAALALAGCTSSHPSRSASTSSTPAVSSSVPPGSAAASSAAAAASAQLAKLLIKASDIPGDTFTLASTSPVNEGGAVGTSAVFANGDHQREFSIILIRYPTVDDAQEAAPEEQTVAAGELTHNPASDTEEPVGQLAHLYQGSNDTGPLSILVFAEGSYVVTMEFISKTAGDNVPASLVTDLGKKQDALLKAK